MNIYGHKLDLTDKKLQKKGIDYILISHFKNFPFFSNLLLNSADIEDISEKEPDSLAYTFFNYQNERIKICLNFKKIEDGINNYTFKEEDVFNVMIHELLHNYFEHLLRFKNDMEKYPEITNRVLDYYINDFIKEIYPSFSSMESKLGLINYDSLNDLAKLLTNQNLPFYKTDKKKPIDRVLLEWFLKNLDQNKLDMLKKLGNKCTSGGPGGPGNINDLDSHDIGKEKEEESLKKLNEERESQGKPTYNKEIADTIKSSFLKGKVYESQCAGTEADLFLREIENIYKKETFLDFIKIKNSIKTICKDNYFFTYSKSNRKKIVNDVIFKGKKQDDGVKLVIAVDVSGSITEKELEAFYNMIATFLETGYGERFVDIIYWSAMELDDSNLHRNINDYKKLFSLKIESNGGTDVSTLYDFIEKRYKREKITLLNITDGFWSNENLPNNVVDYFLALTSEQNFEDKSFFYRKAKIKVYNRI
ncbi:MAG: hypothetical protein ACRCXT_10315 [Paraclostridium sp.]